MLSSYLVSMLFADLLSLNFVTFNVFYSCIFALHNKLTLWDTGTELVTGELK